MTFEEVLPELKKERKSFDKVGVAMNYMSL